MKTYIINIGNSKGVILPTDLLKELKLSLKSAVQIFMENGSIVIKPALRRGWEEAAQEMHAAGDDELLLPEVFEDENIDAWTWEEMKK